MTEIKTPPHEDDESKEDYYDRKEYIIQVENSSYYDSPTLFLDGDDTFRIIHPIGTTSFNRYTINVYKASHQDHGFVSLTYARQMCIGSPHFNMAYTSLAHRVSRNNQLPNHKNLLGITNSFYHQGHYCVVSPYMEMGSIRSIMSARFLSGMPESCILLVLSDILNGLSVIHGAGHVHTQIDASHVFFNGENEIKLAYLATLWNMDSDRHRSEHLTYRPGHLICEWAAAPEAFGSSDPHVYTEKTDIWAIGITALELAYGRLKVTSREGLERMVKKISVKHRLPKKSHEYIHETSLNDDQMLCFGWGNKKGSNYTQSFSRGFESMVAKCLDKNPAKRPTVDELLRFGVFDFLNKSSVYRRYAYDLLKNNNNN